MLTKSVIASSVLAILAYSSVATPALAKGPADPRTGKNVSRMEACHPQEAGALSPGSDFVATPYTFGSTLYYRPAWTGEMQTRTDAGRKMSERRAVPSPAPHC